MFFYLNAATTLKAIETKETSNTEEPEEAPAAVFVPPVAPPDTPAHVKASGAVAQPIATCC